MLVAVLAISLGTSLGQKKKKNDYAEDSTITDHESKFIIQHDRLQRYEMRCHFLASLSILPQDRIFIPVKISTTSFLRAQGERYARAH